MCICLTVNMSCVNMWYLSSIVCLLDLGDLFRGLFRDLVQMSFTVPFKLCFSLNFIFISFKKHSLNLHRNVEFLTLIVQNSKSNSSRSPKNVKSEMALIVFRMTSSNQNGPRPPSTTALANPVLALMVPELQMTELKPRW